MKIMSSSRKNIGLKDGKFFPCPKTPNCVSTQSPKDDKTHYIKPISYNLSLEETKRSIIEIIESIKRTKIATITENYIHAEFKTKIFKFTDDVEFYFDDNRKIIHFRSASRVGKSDLGVNRKRMEIIKEKFQNT